MTAEPITTCVTVSGSGYALSCQICDAGITLVWSNFEIADMDFWRGETYMSFFEYLDRAGGFYYEASSLFPLIYCRRSPARRGIAHQSTQRWGDAPVHSIAAAIFLPRSAIHFFDEIGYEHPPFTHCPINQERWANGRCSCNPDSSFDYDGYSCLQRWQNVIR